MSFFDKLKSGVADAGNKAKVTVEVNRLKMQNNSKRKEIDQVYSEIGKLAFHSFTGRGGEFNEEVMNPFIEKIIHVEAEIEANVQQIKALSDERDCSCGKTIAKNARFCPHCGHDFTSIIEKEDVK